MSTFVALILLRLRLCKTNSSAHDEIVIEDLRSSRLVLDTETPPPFPPELLFIRANPHIEISSDTTSNVSLSAENGLPSPIKRMHRHMNGWPLEQQLQHPFATHHEAAMLPPGKQDNNVNQSVLPAPWNDIPLTNDTDDGFARFTWNDNTKQSPRIARQARYRISTLDIDPCPTWIFLVAVFTMVLLTFLGIIIYAIVESNS